MKVISIVNNKGGVAKTTTTIHLGHYLSKLSHNVLLIDFDPQQSLSERMEATKIDYSVVDFLCENNIENIQLQNYGEETLYILNGSEKLKDIEVQNELYPLILKNQIRKLENLFDFILIDCSPGLMSEKGMTTNEVALIASDYVLSPMGVHSDSLTGIIKLNKGLERVKKYNTNIKPMGAFFVIVDEREKLWEIVKTSFKQNAPEWYMDTYIRKATDVKTSETLNLSVLTYNQNSKASWDYKRLGNEILNKMKIIR